MTKQLFDGMLAEAERIVTQQLKLDWEDIALVSGGAAWSDHVAVQLYFLHGCDLMLYFPCGWDDKTMRFVDSGGSSPGRSANRYHTAFSSSTGYNSLRDIQLAMLTGAVVDTSRRGFHARNTAIAEHCDILIAFSWGAGNAPMRVARWTLGGNAMRHAKYMYLSAKKSTRDVIVLFIFY